MSPIKPNDGPRPLDFDKPEPSTSQRLGAGHQYDYAPGMAPKPRDPAVDAAIEAWLAKHSVTKIPTGFATTAYGRKAVSDYKGRAADDAKSYCKKLARLDATDGDAHNAGRIDPVHATIYADNLSLAGGLLALAPMPEGRWCAYPGCTNGSFAGRPCRAPMDPDLRSDKKHCSAKCKKADARRLSRLPIPGTLLANADSVNQINELGLGCVEETETRNTIRGLLTTGKINRHQLEAANVYQHDLDAMAGRLRAPMRDELDISVWRPPDPDSANLPWNRLAAANKVVGAARLASTISLETLQAALNALIKEYENNHNITKDSTNERPLQNDFAG